MKIVLEAFGKLRSEPMDVPENVGPIWKMALSQPLTAIGDFDGKKISEIGPIETMCEFEYIGKLYSYGPGNSAKIYVLKDIYKR